MGRAGLLPQSVAIIGSFKQNYREVLADWHTFAEAGLRITSPKGGPIIEPGIDFIRFETDDASLTDAQIQQIALHRILSADFVYAELPSGYVGRTACMEIGRILAANKSLYFSEHPKDLPLEVPQAHVVKAKELVERFRVEMPQPLLASLEGISQKLELGLLRGTYQDL